MTGHEVHEYSFGEALELVSCSESTLRRRLNENGSRLGATKLRHGWRIPVTTLEAMGLLRNVTGHDSGHLTVHDRSDEGMENDLREENTRLRIENATLRAENEGLKQTLSERQKVVALLEARPKHFWQRWHRHDADSGDSRSE